MKSNHDIIGRIAGIDYGSRRIGLAIGETETGIASPAETLTATGGLARDAEAIAAWAEEEGIVAFVVGLPLNMDGTEGSQAATTRRLAELLASRANRPVELWDERLSTFAADEQLRAADLPAAKRRGLRDAFAARAILQSYLDAQH